MQYLLSLIIVFIITFSLQCYSPWVEMQMALPASFLLHSRATSTTPAPLRAGTMVTAGVPLLRTTTGTRPTGSALKLVGGVVVHVQNDKD